MSFLKTRIRLVLCVVTLIAFLLPAYNGVSGLGFIGYAMNYADQHPEIDDTDAYIALLPLITIPVSALYILFFTWFKRRSIKKLLLAFPLLAMIAFMGILFFSGRGTGNPFSSPKIILQMQIGFYISLLASFGLMFTKSHHRKRHGKAKTVREAIIATPLH